MKTIKRIAGLLIVAALLPSINFVYAQPGHPGIRPPHEPVELLTNYSGKVVRYVSNEDKVFDGLILNLAAGEAIIRFPAHNGEAIMNVAKPGIIITVSGFQDRNTMGVSEIHWVSLTANGKTLFDAPPQALIPPLAAESVTISSKIVDFKRDLEGRVNGVYLADNTILNFPPHAGFQFASLLKPGDVFTAQGLLEPKHEGEVYDGKARIVHARVVTINGSSYWVR